LSDCISLYIHIPFCVRKCIYCDFYSETKIALIPDYINSLLKEIRLRLVSGSNIRTIYLGGGTPSLLSVSQIRCILETIASICHVDCDTEITCEVNPGTVNADYLCRLKQTGVNRLSIGVQSFNEDKLKFLERIHSADDAIDTIDNAIKVGFENISLDMIYGVPVESHDEKTDDWIKDMKKALEFNPPHISCYILTIEHGTPLAGNLEKKLFVPFDPEMLAKLFKLTSQYLAGEGFEHYEISNFAHGKAKRSRHNSGYWAMLPYVGLGPGAHSFDGTIRSWNHRNIDKYLKDIACTEMPVESSEKLNRNQQMLEMIMLRLRTLEGLDIIAFEKKFSMDFNRRFNNLIEQILSEKFAEIKQGHFFLNLEGRTCLDSIVEAFAHEIF
jgi:oxygen-independent coproporphyrinogen III oxidase